MALSVPCAVISCQRGGVARMRWSAGGEEEEEYSAQTTACFEEVQPLYDL